MWNGWEASEDRRAIDVAPLEVAGVQFPGGVKSGDVATVLGHVAARFHREVEPLVAGWCWGYYYRRVTGGASLSRHAYGLAIDINAPHHGYGDRGTFSERQRDVIRDILREVAVVRWGGDYTGTPDEMHFEINAGPPAVAVVAARLRARPNEEDVDMSVIFARGPDNPLTCKVEYHTGESGVTAYRTVVPNPNDPGYVLWVEKYGGPHVMERQRDFDAIPYKPGTPGAAR